MGVLHWLRRVFAPSKTLMPKRFEGPYQVFTTEFDREVAFKDAPSVSAFTSHNLAFPDYDLDSCLEGWAPEYEGAAHDLVSSLRNMDFDDTAVCLLVDHSGSLRGEKCCLVAATVGVASECLTRLNARHEVLGFTTRTWRGGEARQKWSKTANHSAPGRLCDLLHIVYRTAEADQPVEYDGLRLMADPRILKENVDGEALQWAARRLMEQQTSRRILIVISDGAPVDASTLLANGPNILHDHLRLVARDIVSNQKIELCGVGIHYGMWRYYPQYLVIERSEDIGGTFLPVLRAILTGPTHAPNVTQLPDA